MNSNNTIRINQSMNKILMLFSLIGLINAVTLVFMIIVGNYVFALDFNNKFGIKFDYTNIIYLDWINPSIEENSMIIPITANFKNSNQYKITSCAQSYHNMIPKIYRDLDKCNQYYCVNCSNALLPFL